MLKNKLHVYGEPHGQSLSPHANYGQHMLQRLMMYRDKIAHINTFTDESLTYGELAQLIVDNALSLSRIGVGNGQVIGICSENRNQAISTLLGIICTGAVYTEIPTSGKTIILHRLQIIKPTVIFCCPDVYRTHKDLLQSVGTIKTFIIYGEEEQEGATLFKNFITEHADVLDFLPAPVDAWTDTAMLFFSSGTTGLPKAIPMTHFNCLAGTDIYFFKRFCSGKPQLISNNFLEYRLCCFYAGATVIFSPLDQLEDILKGIQKYKVKILQQFPSVLLELVKYSKIDQYDLSSLEYIRFAGAPIDSELIKSIKTRIPSLRDVYQDYGLTETWHITMSAGSPQGSRLGSVGCALPGVVIKVVDQITGKPLGANQPGEICVRSPSLSPGYLGQTTAQFLDEEGFFKTGDVGYYDEDKYFYIVDRIKDMIKNNGYAVSAAELEAVLLANPAVREAGVVGAPHAVVGELPTAFVVLQPGAAVNEDELLAYMEGQVASYMLLKGGIRFVAKLPRGRRGKLDRKELRQML